MHIWSSSAVPGVVGIAAAAGKSRDNNQARSKSRCAPKQTLARRASHPTLPRAQPRMPPPTPLRWMPLRVSLDPTVPTCTMRLGTGCRNTHQRKNSSPHRSAQRGTSISVSAQTSRSPSFAFEDLCCLLRSMAKWSRRDRPRPSTSKSSVPTDRSKIRCRCRFQALTTTRCTLSWIRCRCRCQAFTMSAPSPSGRSQTASPTLTGLQRVDLEVLQK
mmetsp:Transcript_69547/g.226531  ORF Transcript_69547/g.226531 Transcript_69547/m.226531 type:complete len:216 (+) Transcript_69547:103-750(+)